MATGSADTAIGVLGVDLDANDTSAQHDLALEVNTRYGKAVYAKAAADSPRGSLCTIAPASAAAGDASAAIATLVSTGNVNSAPGFLGINQVDVSADKYGWFYTEANNGVVRALQSCAPLVPLYTTGTAGAVDDAVVSTGRIEGLRLLATAATATATAAIFHNMTRITQDIA